MAEIQLFYIATNKFNYITSEGAKKEWTWGSMDPWKKYKKPVAKSTKKVKYNKKKKSHAGKATKEWLPGDGKTHLGTVIPKTKSHEVNGVTYPNMEIRYKSRGYTKYTRTAALKKKKKMKRTIYTSAKPYQYRIQYKDKQISYDEEISTFINEELHVFFADHYYKAGGIPVQTGGHIAHPVDYKMEYKDIRKNMDMSAANNNETRDNKGAYILQNVRANVRVITCKWAGLNPNECAQLLAVLNPDLDTSADKPYITIQFLDYEKNAVQNSVFFAGDRSVTKYKDGTIKEISCKFEEV